VVDRSGPVRRGHRDGSIDPVPALAALLAAAGGLLAGRPAPRGPIEIGVDDSGCIAVRRGLAPGTPLNSGFSAFSPRPG